MDKTIPPMIVFSHLRWEFVKQRPQHLIGRLAKHRPILFVEESAGPHGKYPSAKTTKIDRNLYLLKPNTEWGNYAQLVKLIETSPFDLTEEPIIWFFSPLFVKTLNYLPSSLIVYDCMDELSHFKNAPADLPQREQRLLKQTDLVFTGGKSLYEAKQAVHDNVYCFPSSVDQAHFAAARVTSTQIPQDIASLPKPIVGFYGVIDERIDRVLLLQLSQLLPEVSFVMIGPRAKIHKKDLPQAPNLYYLGKKEYEKLPAYLKAFEIAMMPFAINKATKFISPTKTLEYMAALKPIISTPVYDVMREYGQEVKIAANASAFAVAIKKFLNESESERLIRERLQTQVLQNTSWNLTALKMNQLIESMLTEKTQPDRLSIVKSDLYEVPSNF